MLHNIRSVQNVGSIFRTADAAGVTKIFLTGYTPAPIDRFGRERRDFAKTALGSEKSILWEEHRDPPALIKELKALGVMVVSLEQAKHSKDYKKFSPTFPFALVLGNEVEGLPEEILKESDYCVEIPMAGMKESLNVSVAGGIALFRLLENAS